MNKLTTKDTEIVKAYLTEINILKDQIKILDARVSDRDKDVKRVIQNIRTQRNDAFYAREHAERTQKCLVNIIVKLSIKDD